VYRRGFLDEDEEGEVVEGEVDVRDEREGLRTPGRMDVGETMLRTIESDSEEGISGEGIVARATTPPANTLFVPSDTEDNPWL